MFSSEVGATLRVCRLCCSPVVYLRKGAYTYMYIDIYIYVEIVFYYFV